MSLTPSGRGGGLRYPVTLGLAAITILVAGLYFKPKKETPRPEPEPSAPETQRLHRRAQRAAVDSMTEYFASVAADIDDSILTIASGPGSVIAWNDTSVVVPAREGPWPASISILGGKGEVLPAVPFVGGPTLPLAVLRVSAGSLSSALKVPTAPPTPGSWLLAVWRRKGGTAFVPGHFVASRPVPCGELGAQEIVSSLVLSEAMSGGGIFDLDGALLAVVLPCEGRLAALSVASVTQAIAVGRTPERQMLGAFGIRIDEPDETECARLGVHGGALVRETWQGYPADAAGLRPGDVIDRADGEPVDPAALVGLLAASREVVLGVRRSGRELALLMSRETVTDPPVAEEGQPHEGGILVESVRSFHVTLPGVEAGDRVVRIDGVEPRDPAQARRLLSRPGGQPAFVELARGPRRFGHLVEQGARRP